MLTSDYRMALEEVLESLSKVDDDKRLGNAVKVLTDSFSKLVGVLDEKFDEKDYRYRLTIDYSIRIASRVKEETFLKYIDVLKGVDKDLVLDFVEGLLYAGDLKNALEVTGENLEKMQNVAKEIRDRLAREGFIKRSIGIASKVDKEVFGRYLNIVERIRDEELIKEIPFALFFESEDDIKLIVGGMEGNLEKFKKVIGKIEPECSSECIEMKDENLREDIIWYSIKIAKFGKEIFGKYLDIAEKIEKDVVKAGFLAGILVKDDKIEKILNVIENRVDKINSIFKDMVGGEEEIYTMAELVEISAEVEESIFEKYLEVLDNITSGLVAHEVVCKLSYIFEHVGEEGFNRYVKLVKNMKDQYKIHAFIVYSKIILENIGKLWGEDEVKKKFDKYLDLISRIDNEDTKITIARDLSELLSEGFKNNAEY